MMPLRTRLAIILAVCSCLVPQTFAQTRFEISFPASEHAGPLSGRLFVVLAKSERPDPIQRAGSERGDATFFGVDVEALEPRHAAIIDARAAGYPSASLKDLPAGDYYAQALFNVYTEFHRADGHIIQAHMDQWEGQRFNRSPGNLYSDTVRVHLEPATGFDVRLELTKTIPPVETPPDTAWVKHVKIQSRLLTKFWGRPMYLGATVLLPKGYADHPEQRYPTIYHQFHFDLNPPFGFSEKPPARGGRGGGRGQSGFAFFQQWTADDFPRVMAVTFQHPTPFYDDSYAVNSANNGPYGDALTQELIPYLEEHFRMVREPWGRTLTGGSTGGWEALALQVFHPDLFGGAWVFCPDPIDFRRYQLVNIYDDENAFEAPGPALRAERPMQRMSDGQATLTMRSSSQLEDALGSKGRSTEQFEAWEAVYGPVGDDGYPRPLWDKKTGQIDHEVAKYMRDHNFDLTWYLKTNWPKVGPQLTGKLHFYVGDMDSYYLNLAVYLLEDFLKTTDAGASFEYGRPLKGHMWYPMSNADLVRMMAAEMRER